MLHEGKAVGGPRDGAKLSAERNWDGMVLRPQGSHASNKPKPYPGRYVYQMANGTWFWVANKSVPGSRTQLS